MLDSKFNLSLGKWLGIPVILHWSWLLLFVCLLYLSPVYAIVFTGLFFLVLLHELGHCMATRKFGLHIQDIIMMPIGGAARIEITREPMKEIVVALAGPAVNVILIPVFLGLLQIVPQGASNFLTILSYYNIVLLVFNLIPCFPMDGGRVLRAGLAHFMNDRVRATVISGRIGQVICAGFVVLGLMCGQFFLVLIGVFIGMQAQREIEMVRLSSQFASQSDLKRSAKMIEDVGERLRRVDCNNNDERNRTNL